MSSVNPTSVELTLEKLYGGVNAPNGFQSFVETAVRVFDLKAAMMLTSNVVTQEATGLWVEGMKDEWINKYSTEFAGLDMLAQHIAASPQARFYASNLDLPAKSFVDSRFYRGWVLPQNIGYACGALMLAEGAWSSQIMLQRRPDQAPFSREELDVFNRLIPHLERAIQLRRLFAQAKLAEAPLAAGLDVIAMASVLIDEFGKIMYVNRAAQILLDRGDALSTDGRHLRTSRAEVTQRMNAQIISAVRASRGEITEMLELVMLPRDKLPPLVLMASPIRLDHENAIKGGAVLFIYDSRSTPILSPALIERLFCLTEAEAQLAVALCAGRTLDEAAAERGTSLHTVRSQLKGLFGKTGTNRQADLIVLLLSSPAYFHSNLPASIN